MNEPDAIRALVLGYADGVRRSLAAGRPDLAWKVTVTPPSNQPSPPKGVSRMPDRSTFLLMIGKGERVHRAAPAYGARSRFLAGEKMQTRCGLSAYPAGVSTAGTPKCRRCWPTNGEAG